MGIYPLLQYGDLLGRIKMKVTMNDFDYSIYYGQYHDASDEHFDFMASRAASILSPMLPFERDLAVVDIGCGHGFALEALRRLGFTDIVGVEISDEQAKVARRRGFDVALVADTNEWLGHIVPNLA